MNLSLVVYLSNVLLAVAVPIHRQVDSTAEALPPVPLVAGIKDHDVAQMLTAAEEAAEDETVDLSDQENHGGIDSEQVERLHRRMIFGSSGDGTLSDMIRGLSQPANHAEVSTALQQFDTQAAGSSTMQHEAFKVPAILVTEHDVPTQDELFDLVFSQENEDRGLPASSSSSTVELGPLPDPSSYKLATQEGTKADKSDRGIRSIAGHEVYRKERDRQLPEGDSSSMDRRNQKNALRRENYRKKKERLDVNRSPLPETEGLQPTRKGVTVRRHQYASEKEYNSAYVAARTKIDPEFKERRNANQRNYLKRKRSRKSTPLGSLDSFSHQLVTPTDASPTAPFASLSSEHSSTHLRTTGARHEVGPSDVGGTVQVEAKEHTPSVCSSKHWIRHVCCV